MTQTMHFRLRPGMSTLSKEWADTDAYWTRPAITRARACGGSVLCRVSLTSSSLPH